MSNETSIIVIPARLHSHRLPRKMLLRETGKTLLQHTYEACLRATRPREVRVASGDQEILSEAVSFGGLAEYTDPNAASGTDRVAEVARRIEDVDIVVNVQGDEPEIQGSAIDMTIDLVQQNRTAVMSTLAVPIREQSALVDPNRVKVVFDKRQRALYFSRSPIPHVRDWDDSMLHLDPPLFFEHLGIYAFRREFLLSFVDLPKSRYESSEKLEQLRVLESGFEIQIGLVDEHSGGIDTRHEYEAFVQRKRSNT